MFKAAEIEARERVYHYGNNDHHRNHNSNDHNPGKEEGTYRRGIVNMRFTNYFYKNIPYRNS